MSTNYFCKITFLVHLAVGWNSLYPAYPGKDFRVTVSRKLNNDIWFQLRKNERKGKEVAMQHGEDGDSISSLLLYNTASRTKEPINTLNKKRVTFYSCGPTIYDHAHIGNFRAFLTYDVLKRWLLYKGCEVDHICNLTDVDDKIIKRMSRDNLSLRQLTDKYAELFFEDLTALNILPARHYPRATDHIPEIVSMIQKLLDKGLAYRKDGSTYFRVAKCDTYGSLSNINFEGLQDGSSEGGGIESYDSDVYEKESARDFALWKAYKSEDGDVFWETSLGKGRPGWHIECSAMALKYLGETIDIHAGGVDLVFPHHENEMAQSEGATGKKFCNCWVHNGFVNVSGEKMSKSRGNFLTLRSALQSSIDVRAFRYLVVTSHYRSPLNFTEEALKGAKKAINRLDNVRILLEQYSTSEQEGDCKNEIIEEARNALKQFERGMDDDLNAPRAAAGLFSLVKIIEKALKARSISNMSGKMLLEMLEKIDCAFGIFYQPVGYELAKDGNDSQNIDPEVYALIEKRKLAKMAKNWTEADAIRLAAEKMGYILKDISGGEVEVSKIRS